MSEDKTTPRASRKKSKNPYEIALQFNGKVKAVVFGEDNEETAALIVKAVNSHDKLVEAARELVEATKEAEPFFESSIMGLTAYGRNKANRVRKALTNLQSVLAEVEGE